MAKVPPVRSTWSGRIPLAWRILAVNTLPLALLAGSFFYIDSFRMGLIAERLVHAQSEARLIAIVVKSAPVAEWRQLVDDLDEADKVRIRVIDGTGMVVADSWGDGRKSFTLRDPNTEAWQRKFARRLDEMIDYVADATVPPAFKNYELRLPIGPPGAHLSLAPDRSHMIEARAAVDIAGGPSIVTLRNARDIRRLVRAERSQLGYMLAISTFISLLLSLFLARTIVRPLQKLASAATDVRFGQAREVDVPRLPARRDEIGQLARAISDMSHTLREQMDAIEAFAADVAHELKNPLASMGSAVQSLQKVTKPELRKQLHDIISDDVRRLDRLITDISDLSRIDVHIAHVRFERIDLGKLIEQILAARKTRYVSSDVKLAFARPKSGTAIIRGDSGQIMRMIDNLIDNAVSFSPAKGVVRIAATRGENQIILTVDDDGPGVPEDARSAIFERFHSDRPPDQFGRHSGLGLAIAKAIVDAHGGSIRATARDAGRPGASFVVQFPFAIG